MPGLQAGDAGAARSEANERRSISTAASSAAESGAAAKAALAAARSSGVLHARTAGEDSSLAVAPRLLGMT